MSNIHLFVEILVVIFATQLCFIHRHISINEEVIGSSSVFGANTYTDAYADEKVVAVENKRI